MKKTYTVKEAEHFFIEHDWKWDPDGYWNYKGWGMPAISIGTIEENPTSAVKWAIEQMEAIRAGRY